MNRKNIASSGTTEKKYLNNELCHLCLDESSCDHDLVIFLKYYKDEQLIMINLGVVMFSFLSVCLMSSRNEERNG